jgi:hypothetical protein
MAPLDHGAGKAQAVDVVAQALHVADELGRVAACRQVRPGDAESLEVLLGQVDAPGAGVEPRGRRAEPRRDGEATGPRRLNDRGPPGLLGNVGWLETVSFCWSGSTVDVRGPAPSEPRAIYSGPGGIFCPSFICSP